MKFIKQSMRDQTVPNQLIFKGSTAYYEKLIPEVKKKLDNEELVFLHYPLFVGCNYRCLKCFSDGIKAYLNQMSKRGIVSKCLDSSTRKKLFEEAFYNGVKTVVIAGAGEPFMSPELDDVINLTSYLGMNLIVFTNGSLINEQQVNDLFSKGVSIAFTLDSVNEKNYDLLTKSENNLKRVIQNLKSLLSLSEQYSSIVNGYKVAPLAVNTNVSSINYNPKKGINEIENIHNLIGDRAAHYVSNITPTGNAIKNWKLLHGDHKIPFAELIKKYSNGLGGTSRRENGKCAYIHNGAVQFCGYWMTCPNQGLVKDSGRYPEVRVMNHFKQKKELLKKIKNPLCVTRKE